MNLKSSVKIILKAAVVFIIVFFLVRSVLSNWGNIREYDWSFNPLLMALSCLIYFIAYALVAIRGLNYNFNLTHFKILPNYFDGTTPGGRSPPG